MQALFFGCKEGLLLLLAYGAVCFEQNFFLSMLWDLGDKWFRKKKLHADCLLPQISLGSFLAFFDKGSLIHCFFLAINVFGL